MKQNLRVWLRDHFQQAVNSIAFYPAIIALAFLFLSFLSISFDFSQEGKHIKAQFDWLRLKDATTARSIISTIASGIISLTVFSFSMVMIVLNQTASQMSNRILDKLIGSRFQQIVLGIYVGTIVYSMFLLSSIRDVDTGVHVPAISTYLLIMLTVLDIFLFIYFLHYITQSVKYDVIIRKIYAETMRSMEKSCRLPDDRANTSLVSLEHLILAPASGIYQGFDNKDLVHLCSKHDCLIHILHSPGSFIIQGVPIANCNKMLSDTAMLEIQDQFYLYSVESIELNFFYGFRQLSEVAIKALSPGINDPATAVESLRALFQLLAHRMICSPVSTFVDAEQNIRVTTKELTFDEIFNITILPIMDYGQKDQWIQSELHRLLIQLNHVLRKPTVQKLLQRVNASLKDQGIYSGG